MKDSFISLSLSLALDRCGALKPEFDQEQQAGANASISYTKRDAFTMLMSLAMRGLSRLYSAESNSGHTCAVCVAVRVLRQLQQPRRHWTRMSCSPNNKHGRVCHVGFAHADRTYACLLHEHVRQDRHTELAAWMRNLATSSSVTPPAEQRVALTHCRLSNNPQRASFNNCPSFLSTLKWHGPEQ